MKDTIRYFTELKALFDMLRNRSDKKAHKELVEKDKRYRNPDEETYEAASVLMNAPSLWKKRKEYSDPEGRNYDMCKALRDWEAEIREEVSKEKDVLIEQRDAQHKRDRKEIDSLKKENAELRAKLATLKA